MGEEHKSKSETAEMLEEVVNALREHKLSSDDATLQSVILAHAIENGLEKLGKQIRLGIEAFIITK